MLRLSGQLHRVGGALPVPVGNSRTAWPLREGLVLGLDDGQGGRGLGEASPLPGFSPDDLASAETALSEALGRGLWLDEALALGPARCGRSGAEEAVAACLAPHRPWLARSPSATFALETALLDLAARRKGSPVWALLGGGGRPFAESALLDLQSDSWRQQLSALLARGVGAVKVKVGRAGMLEREIALVAELRALAGEACELRLDANGAFTPGQAREALAAFAPSRPSLVEEPCSGRALLSLGRCEVAWAADESLSDPDLAREIVAPAPGCSAVVVKPSLLGFFAARGLALSAQRAGLGVVVTHLFDGPVALASAVELALSLPEPPLASGLGRHEGLSVFPAVNGGHARQAGRIGPSPLPGLGLEAGALR